MANPLSVRLRLLAAGPRYYLTKISTFPLHYWLAVGEHMRLPSDQHRLQQFVAALPTAQRKSAEQYLEDNDPDLLPGIPDRMEGYLQRWTGRPPAKSFQYGEPGQNMGTTSMPTMHHQDGPPEFGIFGSNDEGRSGELVLLRVWVKGRDEDFITVWKHDIGELGWIRDVDQGFGHWPPRPNAAHNYPFSGELKDFSETVGEFTSACYEQLQKALPRNYSVVVPYTVSVWRHDHELKFTCTKELLGTSYQTVSPPHIKAALKDAWTRFLGEARKAFPSPWVTKRPLFTSTHHTQESFRLAAELPATQDTMDQWDEVQRNWRAARPGLVAACKKLRKDVLLVNALELGGSEEDWKIVDMAGTSYDSGDVSIVRSRIEEFDGALPLLFSPNSGEFSGNYPWAYEQRTQKALDELLKGAQQLFDGTKHRLLDEDTSKARDSIDADNRTTNVLLVIDATPGEDVNWDEFRRLMRHYLTVAEESFYMAAADEEAADRGDSEESDA